jgi:hypothetical protein
MSGEGWSSRPDYRPEGRMPPMLFPGVPSGPWERPIHRPYDEPRMPPIYPGVPFPGGPTHLGPRFDDGPRFGGPRGFY